LFSSFAVAIIIHISGYDGPRCARTKWSVSAGASSLVTFLMHSFFCWVATKHLNILVYFFERKIY
jgi:hypothetical protein